jgi:hypothetical protein
MPITNDKDLSEDFTCSEAKEVARASQSIEAIDSEASGRLIKSIEQYEEVNENALALVDSKGDLLFSSLLAVMAERDKRVAMALEVGWTVGGYIGIGMFFNGLSKQALGEGELEKATYLRAFSIAVVRGGVSHVQSEAFDMLIGELYAINFSVSEKDWDEAHARQTLEDAEVEVMWQDSQNQ